jgi:hypothetical protein
VSIFLGRELSFSSTPWTSVRDTMERSEPFAKYCLNRPLVRSLRSRFFDAVSKRQKHARAGRYDRVRLAGEAVSLKGARCLSQRVRRLKSSTRSLFPALHSAVSPC